MNKKFYGRKFLTEHKFFAVIRNGLEWRICISPYEDGIIYYSRIDATTKLDEYLLNDGHKIVSAEEFEKLKLLI